MRPLTSTHPFDVQTLVGADKEVIREIGVANGQGVSHREHGTPHWALICQLAQAFHCHPHVFDDYTPAEISLYANYLDGQGRGQELSAKQKR